ncbi:MAG TPA: translation elongation factor Ts [Hyphomicrobiaceae bacterium]|nr:translation elongation factor Ts [Hyphomicrobiaceae bacterium]
MSNITAGMVKELRDKTGAGMMDCKTALTETKGDIEAAVDWLRKKGLSKAAKKADRVAADGLIGVKVAGLAGALVEVNSETDFVARNPEFQTLVADIASVAPSAKGDLAKLLAAKYPGKSLSVEQQVTELVVKIGEKMSVRRTGALEVKSGCIAGYMHNKVADGLGKIGVLVALESTAKDDKLIEIGRQIAMHVAARNPVALDLAGVPADIIAREKAILMEKNKDKPAHLLEKIAEGGLKAYAKENCLLEQVFVLDEKKSVGQALKDVEKAAGTPIKLAGFLRYALGEGIEKKTGDFAAEVAAAVSGTR